MFRSPWRALAAGVITLLVCAISGGVWFVATHRQSASSSPLAAEAEFDRLRVGLTRTQPGSGPLRTFHTVIFDTRGQDRLVHIAVPIWMARRYARHDGEFRWLGELTFLDDTEFDSQPIRLSFADLERRGPGVVADYRRERGGQFLSWVD